MKDAFTCAGIIAAIVLCLVGIAKLPFKTFKAKHPKIYRATFYMLSLVLSVVAPIITQLFILGGELACIEFAVLICATIVGVFFGYSTYEGTQLKTLFKVLVEKFLALIEKRKEVKTEKIAKEKQETAEEIAKILGIEIPKKENTTEEQKTLY